MKKARIGYARKMARKVLKDCRITDPPVDLKVILDKNGYEYIEVNNFPEKIDALFLKNENDGKIYAAVNANHHMHRQRFSLAHEFGHLLLNHDLNYYQAYISIDEPPTEKTHTTTEAAFETEANNFAGELLVPLAMLKVEFNKTDDLKQLSKRFLVSKHVASISIGAHMASLYK